MGGGGLFGCFGEISSLGLGGCGVGCAIGEFDRGLTAVWRRVLMLAGAVGALVVMMVA